MISYSCKVARFSQDGRLIEQVLRNNDKKYIEKIVDDLRHKGYFVIQPINLNIESVLNYDERNI